MKKIIAVFILLIVQLSTLIVPASAAGAGVHMVLGLGRSSAVIENNITIKTVSIADISKEPNAMLCAPLIDNGTIYVPFRFVMENAGFAINWDNEENATTIQYKNSVFTVWVKDNITGCKQVVASKVTYKNDVFTIVPKNGDAPIKVSVSGAKSFFERTYIPVQEIERFGFIIHIDSIYNTIHLISNVGNAGFTKAFEDIFKETDDVYKAIKTSAYYNELSKKQAFYTAFENYVKMGTDYNNHLNNALAIAVDGDKIVSIVGDEGPERTMPIERGARQLTCAVSGTKKYIYYVNSVDRKLYKAELYSSGHFSRTTKVDLPTNISGKSISQIIIIHDRLFFIAYDVAQQGGYVYMAQVGSEKKTAVKLTANRAWNIHVSNDYQLYYTNFDSLCALYAVDLKDSVTLTSVCNYPDKGVVGKCVQNSGIQSISFDKADNRNYYYTDLDSGSVMAVVGGSTPVELLKSDGNTLYNFLNLYSESDGKVLYYIEYPNGRIGNYDTCKIMSLDIYTGEIQTIYNSDKMLMELTVVDKKLYCTNSSYTELYQIEKTGSGLSFNVFSSVD